MTVGLRRPALIGRTAVVLIAGALFGAFLVALPAQAATVLGSLAITPASGIADDPISMTTVSTGTTKGCPAPTTNISGYMTGPGAWANGILVVNNLDTGVSQTADFPVELADSLTGISQVNTAPITAGKYTVTVYCQNELGTTRFGEFTAPLWFTDATHYVTSDPAIPTPTQTPTPTTTTPGPTPTTVGPTPTTSPTPTSGTGQATTTTLAVTPSSTAVEGTSVTLTATVAPATAAGAVQFTSGAGASAVLLGSAAPVNGTATFSTTGLGVGVNVLGARFVPTDAALFAGSTSATINYSITPGSGPAVLGTLEVQPPSGTVLDPIYLQTRSAAARATKGCVSPSTNFSGFVTGPGGWAAGILLVQNDNNGISLTDDFLVAASDSFTGVAAVNSLTVLPGRYDIALYCQDELGGTRFGQFTTSIWFTDATHYQSNNPDSSQTPTGTVLSIGPEDRADLGTKVTLTAAVTPASATGSIQFRDNRNGTYGKVGLPVPVSDGKAALSSTTFAFSMYQFSAVFTPADPKKLGPSSSKDVVFVVALPIPPVPKSGAALSGRAAVGQTLGCSASFSNAKTIQYEWIRDRSTLPATTSKYRLVSADRGHAIRCRVLATNAGGTTSRTSAPVRMSK